MSQACRSYMATLFESKEHSDCTVVLALEEDQPPAPKRPKTRNSVANRPPEAVRKKHIAMPAHMVILCGGSEGFRTVVAAWKEEHGPDAKPMLRVQLHEKADVPYARAVLRFMYTGRLQAFSSVKDLLKVRQLAVTMQVLGCPEACEVALLAMAAAKPVDWVSEMHACRQLLSASDALDPGVARQLGTCREHLSQYGQQFLAAFGDSAVSSARLGALLSWAFPDAPSLLCDPETRRQLRALPAPALKALLQSDAFATDDEASVLLMLATWLDANPTTSREVRDGLCLLVRLSHLNAPYLHGLLPRLTWFPISRDEHGFLCQYKAAPDDRTRKLLAGAAVGKYDCNSAWYKAPRRPPLRSDAGKPYDWHVKQEDLHAHLELALQRLPRGLTGAFSNGASRLVAQGFDWYPGTLWSQGADEGAQGSMEAALCCAVPPPLSSFVGAGDLVGVVSIQARLTVYRWRDDGTREEGSYKSYGEADAIRVTSGADKDGLWRLAVCGTPSERGPGAVARWMAALGPYIRDGKLQGSLTFLK